MEFATTLPMTVFCFIKCVYLYSRFYVGIIYDPFCFKGSGFQGGSGSFQRCIKASRSISGEIQIDFRWDALEFP